MNWEAIRREFPALANWTYLNTATFGQLPRRGVEAVSRHFAHRDELACSDFIGWFDDMDAIRGSAAGLIHARAEDIAFVSNASAALAVLISGIDWRAGDRVITLENEFPNNIYALGELEARGVEFIECPWERFYESITDRTRLAAISLANYATGFVPPLAEVSRALHARGALLFVDGTQGLGGLQMDVRQAQPDMLAVHGYKWMLSPNGAGFMYVAPQLRERLAPNAIGWRSHDDWRSVDQLHHGKPVMAASAEKYEGGMLPFALLYAMQASIEMMLEIGPDLIEQRVLGLADQARELLRACGGQVEDYRSPIAAARFEGRDLSAIAQALGDRRILVAARHGRLRVSPHFYNHEADLATFGQALHELVAN